MSGDAKRVVVPAKHGVAVELSAGSTVKVVNTHGSQVVDTWAIVPPELDEHLSMEHTRTATARLNPRVGDVLYSNARQPLLTFVADTSPGIHDSLIAACDPERYKQLGHTGPHPSCQENFLAALAPFGYTGRFVPSPLNLFMHVPWTADGAVSFAPPVSRPGDAVTLRAERDLIAVFSACPQDLTPVNGAALAPSDVLLEVAPPAGSAA